MAGLRLQKHLLFSDADLWVFDKPCGVSLLADRSGEPNLWDTLKAAGPKPYLVHRLDKGTSGVLLVARSQATQRRLTRAFNERQVRKFYLAWVAGRFPRGATQCIDLPLCKGRKSRYRVAGERSAIAHENNRYRVPQSRPGVAASTRVRCIAHLGNASLLLVSPRTGRTHQIRVHLSWIGFPLLGDNLYGRPDTAEQAAPRLLLHCHRLVVPGTGTYQAKVPTDFAPPAAD